MVLSKNGQRPLSSLIDYEGACAGLKDSRVYCAVAFHLSLFLREEPSFAFLCALSFLGPLAFRPCVHARPRWPCCLRVWRACVMCALLEEDDKRKTGKQFEALPFAALLHIISSPNLLPGLDKRFLDCIFFPLLRPLIKPKYD